MSQITHSKLIKSVTVEKWDNLPSTIHRNAGKQLSAVFPHSKPMQVPQQTFIIQFW